MTTAIDTTSQRGAANPGVKKRSTNITHNTNTIHPMVISWGFVGLLIALSLHPRVQVNAKVVSAVWIVVVTICGLLCAVSVIASNRSQSLCYKVIFVRAHSVQRVQLNVRVTLGCPLADAEPIILPRLVNASNSQRHHLSKVFQGPPCS